MSKYYLNLFYPATDSAFLESDKTITGFSIAQRGHAQKIKSGDWFICYCIKVTRFFGFLEVKDTFFIDDKPIFTPENDPFVVRFKVNPKILLPVKQSLPNKDDNIWKELSFTRDAEKKRTQTWAYNLQGSLSKFNDEDSKILVAKLISQQQNPRKYDFDEKIFNKYKNSPIKRADDKVVEA